MFLSFSLVAQCISLIFGLLLPSVRVSLYFYSNSNATFKLNTNESGNANILTSSPHTNGQMLENHGRKTSSTLNGNNISTGIGINNSDNIEIAHSNLNDGIVDCGSNEMPKFSITLAIQRIINHVRTSYSNSTVVQWSILWAMSMCGFLQVRQRFVCCALGIFFCSMICYFDSHELCVNFQINRIHRYFLLFFSVLRHIALHT